MSCQQPRVAVQCQRSISRSGSLVAKATLQALVFDCDGEFATADLQLPQQTSNISMTVDDQQWLTMSDCSCFLHTCSSNALGTANQQSSQQDASAWSVVLPGVILESEDLHRRAYNATFQHFNVQCGTC